MLIDGAWVEAGGGDWIESENPFTGKPWAMIARGGPGDVEKAVQAAYAAFKGPWRGMTASARGAVLRKFGDLVAANADRLGELETRDNGKLITEMRGQMRYIPQWFYYFAGLADKVEGRVIPIDKPGVFNFTREELSKRDRSMINLAMISILNRPHELKIHVKGALKNGLTKTEIREVLLQVGIYGGIPCAVDSFRVAKDALAEMDKEG